MHASISDTRISRRTRRTRRDRRTRMRLRDLCDEVLASYRLAQGQDLLSPEERDAARQLLRQVTPAMSAAR